MRSAARLLLVMLVTLHPSADAAGETTFTAFDGRWLFHRSHTTPKGLHNEGQDVLVINTSGQSHETTDQLLTVLDAQGHRIAGPLHIVQTRHSLTSRMAGQTLTIQWSAFAPIASRSDPTPSKLHATAPPCTATYVIRGQRLASTIEGTTDVFSRAKN